MSEKYEETDFGPTAVSEPTKSMQKMSKEEFKEHKKNADDQQKAIKLGYDRIKAKVKKPSVQFSESSSRRHSIWKSFQLTILISCAAFNNKRHNEEDHKRKIGTSCMFHVNIHADLKSRTGLM